MPLINDGAMARVASGTWTRKMFVTMSGTVQGRDTGSARGATEHRGAWSKVEINVDEA